MWTHSVRIAEIIAPSWSYDYYLTKIAYDPSFQVYMPSDAMFTLQQYLSEILSADGDRIDAFRRPVWSKVLESAAVRSVMSSNNKRLVSANDVSEAIFMAFQYFRAFNDQSVLRDLVVVLDEAVITRKQQIQQQVEVRTVNEVTAFEIIETTPDYTNYAIAWTPPLEYVQKKMRGAFVRDDNPIKQELINELKPRGVGVIRSPQVRGRIVLTNLKPEDFPVLKSVFERNEFNTDKIDEATATTAPRQTKIEVNLMFENVASTTDYHIFLPSSAFESNKKIEEIMNHLINLTFPLKGDSPKPPEQLRRSRRDLAQKREERIQTAGTHYYRGKSGVFLRGSYGNYRELNGLLNIHRLTSNLKELTWGYRSELQNSEDLQFPLKGFAGNGVTDGYYVRKKKRKGQRGSGHIIYDPRTDLPVVDKEKFNQEVLQYVFDKSDDDAPPYHLRPLQVDGVRWLYSRQSALLGDEPGVGKSEEMIVAAIMRTKNPWDKNLATGRVLVFTPASVVEQFGLRILATTGSPDQAEQFEMRGFCDTIATDVNQVTDSTKWLVMSYSKISGENAEQRLAKIRNLNFDIMILDECHMTKNMGAATSRNIIQVGKNIPFKWGASATTAANTPDDLHNQLLAVGHPLGYLGRSKFLNQYTGSKTMKIRGTDVVIDPAGTRQFLHNVVKNVRPDFDNLSLEDKYAVAFRVGEEEPIDDNMRTLKQIVFDRMEKTIKLNSDLVLTDVYKKRTKKEVNDQIPDLLRNVERSEATSQQQQDLELATERNYSAMRQGNKDKDDALVRLTARRTAIANAKIPATLGKARDIISAGRKVIIFSCFKQSAQLIATQLQELIAPRTVGLAMGGDIHKEDTIREFKKSPNNMAVVLGVLSSGTGVDFPNIVQDVIINDISWTPKDAEQVEGRAHRVNSQLPVTNHYMVLGNTQDEVIYNLVQKKRHISESIQNIDKAYVEKTRNYQSTAKELQKAQELQWERVQEELKSRIAMEHWAKQSAPVFASNWLFKACRKAQNHSEAGCNFRITSLLSGS